MEPLAAPSVMAFMCTGPDRCAGLLRIAAVLLVAYLVGVALLLAGTVQLFARARSETGEQAARTKRHAYLAGAILLVSQGFVAFRVLLSLTR